MKMVAAEEPRLDRVTRRIKKLAGYKVAVAGAMVGLEIYAIATNEYWNPVGLAILGLAAGIVLGILSTVEFGLVFSFKNYDPKDRKSAGDMAVKLLICSVLGLVGILTCTAILTANSTVNHAGAVRNWNGNRTNCELEIAAQGVRAVRSLVNILFIILSSMQTILSFHFKDTLQGRAESNTADREGDCKKAVRPLPPIIKPVSSIPTAPARQVVYEDIPFNYNSAPLNDLS